MVIHPYYTILNPKTSIVLLDFHPWSFTINPFKSWLPPNSIWIRKAMSFLLLSNHFFSFEYLVFYKVLNVINFHSINIFQQTIMGPSNVKRTPNPLTKEHQGTHQMMETWWNPQNDGNQITFHYWMSQHVTNIRWIQRSFHPRVGYGWYIES